MSSECTIQDVFHRFYPSYEIQHVLSAAQRKAAYHIMYCKTGAFGVNISVCEECGARLVETRHSCKQRQSWHRSHGGSFCQCFAYEGGDGRETEILPFETVWSAQRHRFAGGLSPF